jgi:hypothetical protein
VSRFSDGDSDIPVALYEQAIENALNGKRGQAVLRELEASLLALPEKKLAHGVIAHEGQFCAVGLLAKNRLERGEKIIVGKQNPKTIATVAELEEMFGGEQDDPWNTVILGKAMGFTEALATQIAYKNDGYEEDDTPPEVVYARVLKWVQSRIKCEPVTAQ